MRRRVDQKSLRVAAIAYATVLDIGSRVGWRVTRRLIGHRIRAAGIGGVWIESETGPIRRRRGTAVQPAARNCDGGDGGHHSSREARRIRSLLNVAGDFGAAERARFPASRVPPACRANAKAHVESVARATMLR